MNNSLLNILKTHWPQRGSFVANVLTIMTGTTLSQIFTIAISPILTRLYTPDDFGIMALFLSISTTFAVIVGGRYDMAIMLPKEDEEAALLLVLTVAVVFIISIFSLILLAFLGNTLAFLLRAPSVAPFLWWIPLNIACIGVFQGLSYWSSRKKQFHKLAISRVSQALSGGSYQLCLGYFWKTGPFGLISGLIVGNITSVLGLGINIWLDIFHKLPKQWSLQDLMKNAKKYKKFPQYTALIGLLNTASNMLPLLLFSSFFGPLIPGYYFLAHRVLSTPLSFLGSSFAEVFYQKASEHYLQKKDLKGLILKAYKNLFLIGITPTLILFILAPYLFELIFGADWRTAGEFSRLITPWIFAMFIVSPSTVVFQIVNKQEIYLIIEIFVITSRLASIMVGALYFESAHHAVAFYGFTGLLINLFVAYKIINFSLTEEI